MRIEDIDKNMKIETDIAEPDIVWLDVNEAPFALYGVFYDPEPGCYVRIPQSIADKVSKGVSKLNLCTSGGRIRFKTNSSFIGIRAVQKNRELMSHISLLGQSGFDLYRKNENGEEVYYKSFRPPMGMTEGYSSPVTTDGAFAEYTVHLPLYDNVQALYIALKKDAVLEAPEPYETEEPIVYYGSSITQGGCASRPGNSYPAMLCRQLNANFINLGFSGSCKAEPAMAEYLEQLPMKAFVYDFDHNVKDSRELREKHLPFYRRIRAAHPDLPILFVSAPDVYLHRDVGDFLNRRIVIRENFEQALAEGDKNLWYIDGGILFGEDGHMDCTVDSTHPNDLGFYRMANAIRPILKEMLK